MEPSPLEKWKYLIEDSRWDLIPVKPGETLGEAFVRIKRETIANFKGVIIRYGT